MVTSHAIKRITERTSFRAETAERFAENALTRGLQPKDLPSRERDYLEQQERKAGCITRFYNGCCFIFNTDGVCITVYLAPKWFGRRPYYIEKRRVRDQKKYAQRYDMRIDLRDISIGEAMTNGV